MRFILFLAFLVSFGAFAQEFNDSQKQLISPENILKNGGFEGGRNSWTSSAGTVTSESSIVVAGKLSLKVALSAQTLGLTQDSTLYAAQFADGVQGLAMIRVKTSLSGIKVCSRSAGVTSTSLCVDVQNNNKWGLYKVPFILGATSNGISIASSGALTGDVYVDDAFLGAIDLNANVDQSRVAGESFFANLAACLLQRTSVTLGAFTDDADCVAPTIVRSTMGSWQTTDANNLIQTVNNLPPGTYKATWIIPVSTSGNIEMSLSMTDGATTCSILPGQNGDRQSGQVITCTFQYSAPGNRTFQVLTASASGTVTSNQSLGYSKFILEYFGSGSIYSSSCGANCVDVFSFQGTGAAVVSKENSDIINGNGSVLATGRFQYTFNTGVFTSAPTCTCTPGPFGNVTADFTCSINAITSSSITVNTTQGNVSSSEVHTISCQKQGADFVATRTIVGTFNEVVTAPGITKPKTCYYAFGGAAATLAAPTECTTGTCIEVYDTCGAISPPARNAAGDYRDLTIANGTFTASTPISCSCIQYDTTDQSQRQCAFSFHTGDQSWSTNASGGYVGNIYGSSASGSNADGYVQVKCEGQAP